VPPAEVHWFRYEALATFLSGFVLLNLVYYHGGLMVDPIDPQSARSPPARIGVATLIVGWAVYDLLARTSAGGQRARVRGARLRADRRVRVGLSTVLSTRATYIHVGACSAPS
jgi:uncharacterized membrane protein